MIKTNASILKIILVSLLSFLISMFSYGQKQEEYRIHLKSIDTTYFEMLKVYEDVRMYHTTNANLAIVQAMIQKDTSHLKFISNRNILPQIKRKSCDTTQVVFQDSLKGLGKIHFKISLGKFDEVTNQITLLEKEGYGCRLINGKNPYGADFCYSITNGKIPYKEDEIPLPYEEIKSIEITFNGTKKTIPNEIYNDLFDFYTCEGEYSKRQMELYSSLNGDYIYLYIYGGSAASSYFTKLIFDKEGKYITRIIADYRDLLETRSFREGFIGF